MPANYQCYTMKNSLYSLSVLSPTFENAEQQQNTPHAKKKKFTAVLELSSS